jgi:hypothetical protein
MKFDVTQKMKSELMNQKYPRHRDVDALFNTIIPIKWSPSLSLSNLHHDKITSCCFRLLAKVPSN